MAALDDDADDGSRRRQPPLPPEDRIWRHPSELGASRLASTAPSTPSGARARRWSGGVPWWSLPGAFALGAAATLAVIAVATPTPDIGPQVIERVDAAPAPPGPTAAAERALPAIVSVVVHTAEQTTRGSGIMIRSDGHLLTGSEVVADAEQLTITTPDGQSHPAELIGQDADWDLAVIKVAGNNWPTAVLGSTTDLQEGERLVAVAASSGPSSPPVAGELIVRSTSAQLDIDGTTMTGLLSTSPPPVSMGAGAVLVDHKGAVVGVVTGHSPPTPASGSNPDSSASGRDLYAVAVGDARQVAEDLISPD